MPERLAPTELEIASGIVIGEAVVRAGDPAPGADPQAALEAAVVPALHRPPCLVSFSGGFDSTVVLAAALAVARREGLPAPVPITWRFPDAPHAQESGWQERVIGELGVDDWERLAVHDELDLLGPVASRAIARHGVLYPPNAFLHLPLLERARGGTLLTGVGGDEVLGNWRWRNLPAGRRPHGARDAARWAVAHAPSALGRARERRRMPGLPWLRAGVEREVLDALARERLAEPRRWDRRVAFQAARRRVALTEQSLASLAEDAGAAVAHPLLAPGFVSALAGAGGRQGFGDRRATLAATLSDLVPSTLRPRTTKAVFNEAFWTGRARELAAAWDGRGVDQSTVDADALREVWKRKTPDLRSAMLLHRVALDERWVAIGEERDKKRF